MKVDDDLRLKSPTPEKSDCFCRWCKCMAMGKDKLNNYKMPENTKCCWCLLSFAFVLGLICLATGITMLFVLDPFVRSQIEKKVVLSNESDLYEVWQDIPVPIYMEFWLYNVSNIQEVLNGKPPKVTQMGPYTYKERREKYDIIWNPNGTVTYKQNRTFTFLPNLSVGNETDFVTTINPLIPVLAFGLKTWSYWTRAIIVKGLSYWPVELFFTRSVKELLWGYDDPVLEYLKGVWPDRFDTSRIGYFIRKNNTHDGVYTVHTGENNISDVGKVSVHKGKSELDIWTTKYANMINGTDGTANSPFNFDANHSSVYVSDICRSIKGVYMKDVNVKGIQLRRFGGDRQDMENATANPDNYGFCTPKGTPKEKCLPSGLLNSTMCQEPVDGFYLPAIFSFPHFLHADPKVQKSVIGLDPNVEEHQTTIDMEPWTGLVLQAAKRLQINIFVEKVDFLPQTQNVSTLFFPILWLNESSVTNDKYANMLKDQLFSVKSLAENARVIAIITGGVLVLVSVILLVLYRRYITKFDYIQAATEFIDKRVPVYLDV